MDCGGMRHVRLLFLALRLGTIVAHGHLLTPDFRRTMAFGPQIRGYYVYHPFTNFDPHCVQGHCFGPTSFRCKDTAADVPSATLHAGRSLQVQIYYQAFHPGDCSFYISFDTDKTAPRTWLVLSHHPGCAGAAPRDVILPGVTTLVFNLSLPSWLPTTPHAVLRWEWNAVHQPGSRQLYCDCADVRVAGTAEPVDQLLSRVGPHVTIDNGPEHLRGNGHVRFPYGSRREFGLEFMLGGQAVPGGALAVATVLDPNARPPPPLALPPRALPPLALPPSSLPPPPPPPPLPPPPLPTSPPQPGTCNDNQLYMNRGEACSNWVGYDCRQAGTFGYTADDIALLVRSCPQSCRDVVPECHPPPPQPPSPPPTIPQPSPPPPLLPPPPPLPSPPPSPLPSPRPSPSLSPPPFRAWSCVPPFGSVSTLFQPSSSSTVSCAECEACSGYCPMCVDDAG